MQSRQKSGQVAEEKVECLWHGRFGSFIIYRVLNNSANDRRSWLANQFDHLVWVPVGSPQLAGGRYNKIPGGRGYFDMNAFPVSFYGVKPDIKAVSACLDSQEETRYEQQRVSHLCVWMQPDRKLISMEILEDLTGVNRYGYSPLPPIVTASVSSSVSLIGRHRKDFPSASFQSPSFCLIVPSHIRL